MDHQKFEEAIALFQKQFGKTPDESGYSVIDVYQKQHAYLFGKTEDAVKAYKTCQNILRWLMCFYLWPFLIFYIAFFYGLFQFNEFSHPLVAGTLFLGMCWIVLFLVLGYKVFQADKRQKGNVIWLNY